MIIYTISRSFSAEDLPLSCIEPSCFFIERAEFEGIYLTHTNPLPIIRSSQAGIA